MGSFSIWHWLVVLAIVLIVFGGSSKISTLMGDVAKGIKSFKKNMADDESMADSQNHVKQPLSPPEQGSFTKSEETVRSSDEKTPHS